MTGLRDWRGLGWAQKLEEIVTYTIQVGGDVTVGVDDCDLSSKLDDPADDDDIAALVRVQVGRCDTRRRLGLHADRERADDSGCRYSVIWSEGQFGGTEDTASKRGQLRLECSCGYVYSMLHQPPRAHMECGCKRQ